MSRNIVIASAVVLLITGCGGSVASTTSAPATTPSPSTTAAEDPGAAPLGDRLIGCAGGPFFPATALDEIRPVADGGPEVEAAMREFLDGAEGQFWPQDGWRILHETGAAMLLVYHDPDSGGISFMDLEVRRGAWHWGGGSSLERPCLLETTLPEGLGRVDWRLDPAGGGLGPESTVVAVLATERDCASGRSMGDRLLEPEVVTTATQILITLAVQPLPGGQSCPSNPEQPVLVELPEPLGDRELVDGLATGLDLADFLEES
jgi:hypothetical protein